MTEGDPLDMVAYGIGVIVTIKRLKAADLDVTQPWYAADVEALGTYENIKLYFNMVKQFCPGRGYYPKP